MSTNGRGLIALASMFQRVRVGVLAAALLASIVPVSAPAQETEQTGKVAGLPVGILRLAMSSPDPETRRRYFALILQRISRSPAAKQRFLGADALEIGRRLERFKYSDQMLAQARDQTTNTELIGKIDQVIVVITDLRSAAQ